MDMEKIITYFIKATKLRITHGVILTTPAKEIKRMKLRQIEKEYKDLKVEYNG